MDTRLSSLSRSARAIIFAAIILSYFAKPAAAGVTAQGASLQGVTAQGTSVQGVTAQGTSVQGVTAQGISAQGVTAKPRILPLPYCTTVEYPVRVSKRLETLVCVITIVCRQ